MARKLCEKGSNNKKKELGLKFVCKSCGIKSNKENKLCKPKDI